MSKLDELIREFCPNGVEYKRLKSVVRLLKGKPPFRRLNPENIH